MNYIYVFLRSWMLPLKEIDQNTPKRGQIIELGCGQGIIAQYLAGEKGRQVLGVDLDRKRLRKSGIKNLKFTYGDIRKYHLKKPQGVIISDVLHHLNFVDQQKLLKRIFQSLSKDGVLIVKEIDKEELIRGRLSRMWDFVFYPGDPIYFSKSSQFSKLLKKLGFKVEVVRASRFFPGSTTLYICYKVQSKKDGKKV